MPAALAIAAHPDDIEYVMAGTLLQLKNRGWTIHYFNLARGNCGSMTMDAQTTTKVRLREARDAAKILGAHYHPPISNDLEIIYSLELLRKVAAVIREVNPSVVLTHSPQDYMEDHMNTCRLTVTAAFAKNMPNFGVDPPSAAAAGDVTLYHAMPHGLQSPLRQPIAPDFYVETTAVQEIKLAALAAHRSQQGWLASSQGMNSYLETMIDMSREVGRMSGRYEHAEAWRRHLHLGFSQTEVDPLGETLADRVFKRDGAS
ncbi:MAG: PIG-L deacetylase family protein [Verrucomicrobiales bacterium]